jgi:sec-independent protein translocase protein TatA
MFQQFGLPELLIILVIVVVLFGVGRISKIAGEMGSGIRAFKDGLQGQSDKDNDVEKDQAKNDQGNNPTPDA